MYYRLGNNDDAISWYQKTIQVDPRRAVAYVNLADLYYKLDRVADSRPLYEKYLELKPNDTYATTVRARLAQR
jgi:tetratricopeptide (TPR) repeat protein